MMYLIECDSLLLKQTQAWTYVNPDMTSCAAFLTNTNRRTDGTVNFRGKNYFLPRRSISILADWKTVAYNTQKVRKSTKYIYVTIIFHGELLFAHAWSHWRYSNCVEFEQVNCQHNLRTFHVPNEPKKNNQWQMYMEHIPQMRDTHVIAREALELFNMTIPMVHYKVRISWLTNTHLQLPKS